MNFIERLKNELLYEQVDEDALEKNLSKWKKKNPRDYVKKISEGYGRKPDGMTTNMVEWSDLGGFKRVWVKDEEIRHDFPSTHTDYVYSTRVIKATPEQVEILKSTSKSIMVDALKNEVTARCHFLIKNAVTLGFAEDVAKGKISKEEARKEYARRITNDVVPSWYNDKLKEKGKGADVAHHIKNIA